MRAANRIKLAVMAVLLAAGAASAQTCNFTWTGNGGNNDWFTPGNWNPAGPPADGSGICFNTTAAPNLSASFVAQSLFFQAGALVTITSDPFFALQVNAGGITRAAGAGFTISPEVLVLGANQAWSIAAGSPSQINSPIAPLGGTETITKTGAGGLTLAGPSATFGGIDWSGNTLIVTADNALGSGTPVTLQTATSGNLLLSSGGPLNLGNDVTLVGTGTSIVGVSSSVAGTRHTLGTITVPSGATLNQATSGVVSTNLQIGALVLNGTATLSKTNNNTGGLNVFGPVTDTAASTLLLRSGLTNPSAAQLDQGLHFNGDATVNSAISATQASNSAMLGADGAATLTYNGTVDVGGAGRLILIARGQGIGTATVTFNTGTVSSPGNPNPVQLRGDANGLIRFLGGAVTGTSVSIPDPVTWETNGALPTSVSFSGSAGGTWRLRTAAQTLTGGLSVGAASTIDAVPDLTLSGGLTGGGLITKLGAGTLTISGGTHSGGINIAANGGTVSVPGTLGNEGPFSVAANDTLRVDGSLTTGGTGVTVTTGGTVTGAGTINGGVNVAAGANFTPGSGGAGVLTTGPLALADTTNLNFTIGTAGTSATTGPLTLDGILNITAGTGFGLGTYTLFNMSSLSVNNALRQGSAPPGFAYLYDVVGNQVQLTVVNVPTSVEVAKLDALSDGRATQIIWQAGSEVRNLGYRVYREEGGRRREIGGGLIAGSALRARFDPVAGRDYAFVDRAAPRGARYWLQAIDTHGQTQWIGPVQAQSGAISARRMQPSALLASSTPSAVLAVSPAQAVAKPSIDRNALRLGDFFARSNQWRLAASRGTVKLLVRQDGVYRVTAEQLVAAGFPTGAALSGVQLWSAGRLVAFRARSFDGKTLQPGDSLEFFGQAADTHFTDARVYWVSSGFGGASYIQPAATPEPSTTATTFTETLEVRDRTLHIPALRNTDTEGFFGPVLLGTTPMDRVFSTPALAVVSPQPATLEVNLQGLTDGQHNVDVLVNGVGVGTVQSVFQDAAHAVFTLAPGTLTPGDNKVTLVGRTDGEIGVELSQRLTYPRQYAMSGPLRFTADTGAVVELAGQDAAAAHVLDITNPLVPAAVTTRATQAGASLATSGSGARTLYAYRDQDVLVPAAVVANAPSSWHSDGNADLVIIGTQALLPTLTPLVDARRADGFKVIAVDIEDVYDEFSAGEKDATAIRDFLQTASGSWSTKPRFVLLAGAATYDPRGWLGSPELDQVPTLIVDTRYLLTASDDALVTFDPTKGPALAVGRLPLSSPAEMSAAVSKILGRTLATQSGSSLLLVRDRDAQIKFSSASSEVRAALSGWNAQDLVRSDDDDASHTALIAALRGGPAVVDYQGHGAEDFWNGRILTTDDVDALSNAGKTALLVAATCLNGYFQDIGREALGTALLRTPAGGAWGMWASSGMTFPTEHAALSEALLTAALNDGLTLGEATLKAKQAVQDLDIRATFHLLGDPSARAAPAKSPAVTTPTKPAASASGCETPGSPSMLVAMLALLALALAMRRRRPSPPPGA